MIRRRPSFAATIAVAACGVLSLASGARAQQGPTDQTGGQSAGGGGGSPGGSAGSASASTVVSSVYGVVAPPPPGQPIGGGNATESSARPVNGEKEDGFDLAPGGEGGGSVYGGGGGGGGGAVFFTTHDRQAAPMGPAPSTHTIQKGDTLWGICDEYFHNPYEWPKIWAYNPQIQNPHWIYPNEQVRLKASVPLTPGPAAAAPGGQPGGGGITQRMRVPANTVFLRDQGFVNDDASFSWGSIVGSPLDRMYLSDFDEVYVRVAPDHDVKVGQELTVFRPLRRIGDGQVIALQGTLRVDDWNPDSRIARAKVVETLDAIERGARVGPITRRFEVVPPKKDEVDAAVTVMVAVHPHVFYGQNQVVFVNHGADIGLAPGNRLFIIRRGDAWRKSMVTEQTTRRIAGEREEPAVIENTPTITNDKTLPEEAVAELRVLDVQKTSATCLVFEARREIEPGDVAVARKGY